MQKQRCKQLILFWHGAWPLSPCTPSPSCLSSGHSGHKHLQDVALWGVAREGISTLEGKGGRTDKARWKESSSRVLFGFNCFCSFSLALCTELEVWHFKVSFYRNKCQKRWVIPISLKINPSCQRNQNFALKLSLQESRSLLTREQCSCLRWSQDMGLARRKIQSKRIGALGFI